MKVTQSGFVHRVYADWDQRNTPTYVDYAMRDIHT